MRSRRAIPICFLIAATAFAAVPVSGAIASKVAPVGIQREFQTVLNRIDSAEQRRDVDGWAQAFRDNSTATVSFVQFGQKPIGLAAEIAIERAQFSGRRQVLSDRERLIGITIDGHTALAVASYHVVMRQLPNGAIIAASALVHYSLVQRTGRWLIDSVVIIPTPDLGRFAPTSRA